jgi:STE24 endopeptidase
MDTETFRLLFFVVLGLMLATQLWLASRQLHWVVAHRARVPGAFRGKIPLKAHRRAADYTAARTRFRRVDAVIGAVLLVGWTVGGGLDLLDHLVRSAGFGPLATGTLFLVGGILLMGILELPGSIYETFVIEQRFGFNKTTPGLFVADLLRNALIALAFGVPLALTALWLMGRMGTYWWIYVWLLWMGFTLFMVWAYPTLIAPLFNRFRPLKAGPMRTRIQRLLKRTGFKSRGIFVVDSSRRTTHGNAYFTGFGRAKRIVFFDSLLATLRAGEVEAVLAHELGHFKRHHIAKRLAVLAVTSLVGLALLGWLLEQPWFYAALGMREPSTHAALMLFMLVTPVFTFFVQPLYARASRAHEFEADEFAAEQTSARSLVSALIKLYRDNASTLTPDPLHSAFYDSHPPAPLRVARLLRHA